MVSAVAEVAARAVLHELDEAHALIDERGLDPAVEVHVGVIRDGAELLLVRPVESRGDDGKFLLKLAVGVRALARLEPVGVLAVRDALDWGEVLDDPQAVELLAV